MTKHLYFVYLIPFILFSMVPAVAANKDAGPAHPLPETWTAELAVSYALQMNPEVHIALQRLAKAAAMVEGAMANDYPSIFLVAEYSQTNTPMYSFGNILNQGAFDNSIDFNDPGRTDNLNLKADI